MFLRFSDNMYKKNGQKKVVHLLNMQNKLSLVGDNPVEPLLPGKRKKGTRFCKQEPIEAVVQHGACNSFTAYRGTAEVKYIKKLCF